MLVREGLQETTPLQLPQHAHPWAHAVMLSLSHDSVGRDNHDEMLSRPRVCLGLWTRNQLC